MLTSEALAWVCPVHVTAVFAVVWREEGDLDSVLAMILSNIASKGIC